MSKRRQTVVREQECPLCRGAGRIAVLNYTPFHLLYALGVLLVAALLVVSWLMNARWTWLHWDALILGGVGLLACLSPLVMAFFVSRTCHLCDGRGRGVFESTVVEEAE